LRGHRSIWLNRHDARVNRNLLQPIRRDLRRKPIQRVLIHLIDMNIDIRYPDKVISQHNDVTIIEDGWT